jgi:hypothetical protein
MSSMKTMMKLSNFGMKIEFMGCMKCASVFVNPNDMTRYLSYPGSKKHRIEASIRVPRMFNHTHSNNLINR